MDSQPLVAWFNAHLEAADSLKNVKEMIANLIASLREAHHGCLRAWFSGFVWICCREWGIHAICILSFGLT